MAGLVVLFFVATNPRADFFKMVMHCLLSPLCIPCPKCLDHGPMAHSKFHEIMARVQHGKQGPRRGLQCIPEIDEGTIPICFHNHTVKGYIVFRKAALIIVSGYTSINAVVKAELFPAEIRALGVGLPYAVSVSLFGGTAEYIALWLKSIGHEQWFFWYVAGCCAVSLCVYLAMRDTRRHSLIQGD